MPSQALGVRELAQRLVARVHSKSAGPDSAALAAQAACERTYRDLARFLGPTGAQALFTRALGLAQAEHTFLKDVRIGHRSATALEGVAGIIQVHGAAPVAAGLRAVLETLLGLLGRMIGDDMATQLVEQNTTSETHDNTDVK